MITKKIGTKKLIIEKIEELIKENSHLKILDLGCGQSKNFLYLIQKYPHISYVGIEPNKNEALIAQELLKDYRNATIINQTAYDQLDEYSEFDICISLSVLEHVKNLDLFLEKSISHVRKGGLIIHMYDLGHALYPRNLKARFHVFLGNRFPNILPETKFVCYLDEKDACKILEEKGTEIKKITYHQMPNHRHLAKLFKTDSEKKEKLVREIFTWEFKISDYLKELPQKERELLFPSICIWATRK